MFRFAPFLGVTAIFSLLSSSVSADQGSVSLIRWSGDQAQSVDFYVGAIDTVQESRSSLLFWYNQSSLAAPWTLQGELEEKAAGKGEFRVGLGGGKWANCHLVAKSGSNHTSRQEFQFALSARNNYLFPCDFQDWVKVDCGGTDPICDRSTWE